MANANEFSSVDTVMSEKTLNNTLENRWSADALGMGWTAIPSSLFFLQGEMLLSPLAFNVLLNILTHWWKSHEWPHPSQESIALRMGVSIRTVQRGVAELEEKGLVIRLKSSRENPRYKGRNRYDLSPLVEQLEKLTPELKKKIGKPAS